MTQLLPGLETWVALADHESSLALRIVIATPRCHMNCRANGSVRRAYNIVGAVQLLPLVVSGYRRNRAGMIAACHFARRVLTR